MSETISDSRVIGGSRPQTIIETTSDHELKINPWYYVLAWFMLALPLAAVLKPLSQADPDLPIFAGMAVSFLCVYVVATKIEKGRASISGGIRVLVALVVLCLGIGVFSVPFWLVSGEGSFQGRFLTVVTVYTGGAVIAVVLVSVLAWINDSSPRQELSKCLRL